MSKSRIRLLLQRIGVDVQKISSTRPLDWSGREGVHPLEAVYAGRGKAVLLDVPLSLVRFPEPYGYTAEPDSASPFVCAICDYLAGRCTTYKGSVLESFYAQYQPTSAAQVIGLEDASTNELNRLTPYAAVAPWGFRTPDEELARKKRIEKKDSAGAGEVFDLTHGYRHFGPMSKEKGEQEYQRLIRVTESIRKKGFILEPDGIDNLSAKLFVDRSRYRFGITGGQHRIAALAALAYENVTVRLETTTFIDKMYARWWPLVASGWFTTAEAHKIFDQFFESGTGEVGCQ